MGLLWEALLLSVVCCSCTSYEGNLKCIEWAFMDGLTGKPET